jgi:tRNA (adenine22-N1)-methyltransferase
MKELTLSPRLAAIAHQVPQGAVLADVGTDHAYLPVWLLLQGRIPRALASDVNQGPLDRGRETARLYGVADQIDFCRRDGLAGLEEGQADTIAIAGMGGELIARILAQAPWTRDCLLLLQPMSSQPELRQWLWDQGYAIQRETIVREGQKLYTLLTVRGARDPGERPYTRAELFAGRQHPGQTDPLRETYLLDLLRRRRRVLDALQKGGGGPLAEERDLVAGLEELEKEWRAWNEPL